MVATRQVNTSKHPGEPDAPKKRRSSKQVAEEKIALQAQKDAEESAKNSILNTVNRSSVALQAKQAKEKSTAANPPKSTLTRVQRRVATSGTQVAAAQDDDGPMDINNLDLTRESSEAAEPLVNFPASVLT
jgi:hypothetical protein